MFGLFSGAKIQIKAEKQSYALGETVNAEIILTLDKPLKARGFSARVAAYEMVRSSSGSGHVGSGHGHHHHGHSSKQRVEHFAQEFPLDGGKEYRGVNSYKISFQIPNSKALLSQPGFLGFIGGRKITWEITSKLDLEMAIDASAMIMLNVHE